MGFCCLLPRSRSSDSLVGVEDSVRVLSGSRCGPSEQLKLEPIEHQQTLAVKVHAMSMADIDEAPMVKTYGTPKAISREDIAELRASLSASAKHLHLPQKPAKHSKLQGTMRPAGCVKALNAGFRMAPVLDLQKHMPQAFAKIGTLLELAKHLLGIENMAVILLNENHEVTPMATGFITPGAKSRAHGSKQWLLVPSLDQTVIVKDTFQDPRTCKLPYVVDRPHVRFYCSAPLIASNGYHIGHICAMDKDLQREDTNRSAILGNIAGLITRELEKDWAAQQVQQKQKQHKQHQHHHHHHHHHQQQHQQHQQHQQQQKQLQVPRQPKPMSMSQQAFMIVDVAAPGWRVLHMSQHALDRTGISFWSQEKDTPFWSMFSLENQAAPWTLHADAIMHRRFFSVKDVSCDASPSEHMNLIFRPAKSDCLAKIEQKLGVPSAATVVPEQATGSLYVVMVCPAGSLGTQRASATPEQGLDSPLCQGPRSKMCCIHEDRPIGHTVSHEMS